MLVSLGGLFDDGYPCGLVHGQHSVEREREERKEEKRFDPRLKLLLLDFEEANE